jgi:hypothetical protein
MVSHLQRLKAGSDTHAGQMEFKLQLIIGVFSGKKRALRPQTKEIA